MKARYFEDKKMRQPDDPMPEPTPEDYALELFETLTDLVNALNRTNWSSLQTTATFQRELESAEQLLTSLHYG